MDTEALKSVMAQRTPGEWVSIRFVDGTKCRVYPEEGPPETIAADVTPDNARAIVAAVNAIGPLLERVRELEEKVEELEDLLSDAEEEASEANAEIRRRDWDDKE